MANSDYTMPDDVKTWRQAMRDIPANYKTETEYDKLLATDENGNLTHSVWGWSVYGHTDDQKSYVYTSGARSQTTSVVNGLRVSCSTASGLGGTISLYGVVM